MPSVKRLAATAAGLLLTAAPAGAAPTIQTPLQALVQDATEYGRLYGLSLVDAARQLQAQEQSVAGTDALAQTYRDRLAGLVVEHQPAFRIHLFLTGDEPVPDQVIATPAMAVPVLFTTGATVSRQQILDAIAQHQADLRAALQDPPGLGVDERTGRLFVAVPARDVEPEGADALAARLEAIAGVPIEVRAWRGEDRDFAAQGGGRVIGTNGADPQRYLCTSGFAVGDGTREGITTAAHCPDTLAYVDPAGASTPMPMIGAWGAGRQDVQIHVGAEAPLPLVYTDPAKGGSRPITTWQPHAGTRVGDVVCHEGERSGYSCAEVEMVAYAPPGDLCAGPCPASWTAVRGPHCHGGDSGGPVLVGTTALGVVKGGNYATDGACRFYFYMSVDDLPAGWRIILQ